ncbi:PAS domain S-box protein [Pseudomonas entomophila]|uniref:PAS domain-containing sensor histidine kinase n=1 Tax=Pseudomonas entomophila TaxID=312306 RepID=UPI0015E414C5|nr:PAS domain-containing sensor histidine kinase [Pseudomonas entomophila]MBA1190449.1 PAS domain S-box protein [Pseudomonas entomophila]
MTVDTSGLPDARTLFDQAPCGLLTTREDGTLLQVNRTFAEWLGHTCDTLCGQRFQDLLTMGGRIFYQTHWAPLMHMQGSVGEVKLQLLHHDGSAVTMLLNGVRQVHEGLAYYQLSVFTTTERDRYERELLHARNLAENLLREKTLAQASLDEAQAQLKKAYQSAQQRAVYAEQMVGIVSHDLRTPLAAIQMASEMLGRAERSPREARMLSHIGQSAGRAERMIADLLDFTLERIGHGIAISPTPLDLHEVVRQSLDELRVAFPDVKLLHQAVAHGRAPLDADRIQQLIGNLVGNAVAYGDPAQPIHVISDFSQGHPQVTVLNYGQPIPQATLDVLFEPMVRGSEQSVGRSVGLGLFIVKAIAEAHGGTVSVSSDTVDGTRFIVCLAQAEEGRQTASVPLAGSQAG